MPTLSVRSSPQVHHRRDNQQHEHTEGHKHPSTQINPLIHHGTGPQPASSTPPIHPPSHFFVKGLTPPLTLTSHRSPHLNPLYSPISKPQPKWNPPQFNNLMTLQPEPPQHHHPRSAMGSLIPTLTLAPLSLPHIVRNQNQFRNLTPTARISITASSSMLHYHM